MDAGFVGGARQRGGVVAARYEYAQCVRMEFADPGQEFDTAHLRHLVVDDYDVYALPGEEFETVVGVSRSHDAIARGGVGLCQ